MAAVPAHMSGGRPARSPRNALQKHGCREGTVTGIDSFLSMGTMTDAGLRLSRVVVRQPRRACRAVTGRDDKGQLARGDRPHSRARPRQATITHRHG